MAPWSKEGENVPLVVYAQTLRRPRKEAWSPRYTLALLACLGILVEYCQRVNLSIAIIAMAGTTSTNSSENHAPELCPAPYVNSTVVPTEDNTKPVEFSWDAQTQGVVLGGFFWGYLATNLVGGRAAEYLGPKLVFGLGIVLSSLLGLVSPVAARTHVQLFVAVRVLQGAVQGVTFPAVNAMLASWFLPFERSRYSTIVFSGFQLGTVVGMVFTGWLCSSTFLGGWASSFYLFGAVGVVWGVAWWALVYDRPEDHPRLSDQELDRLRYCSESLKSNEVVAIPWWSIMTSTPFLALLACSLGNDYGFYTMLTELPTYLHDVQHFDLSSNGMLSSLPYLLMFFFSIGWAAFMDFLTSRDTIDLLNVRKLSMAVAMFGPMAGLVGMCFVNCNAWAAVLMLCVSGMLMGSVNSGYLCSHQDLAPNLAGTLLGITNTFGALSGVASPAITGYIIQINTTIWGWRHVFLLSAALYLSCGLLYIFLISAEVQHWNNPKKRKTIGQDKASYLPILPDV